MANASKIMSAEQFIPWESMGVGPEEGKEGEWWIVMMVEFAKYHVEAALKSASENVDTKWVPDMTGERYDIDKDSIINAYPLTNIK